MQDIPLQKKGMLSAAWDWYYGSNEEFLLANCQFEKPYNVKNNKNAEGKKVIRPGSLEDGIFVNIFTTAQPNKQQQQLAGLEQCAQNLKILRHPNILRFMGCASVESEIHLVTERAFPLNYVLKETDAHEICSGLHDIALALKFIHEKASVTHNNVSTESIYVTECGTWKLGDFDYACLFKQQTKENLKLLHKTGCVVAPEEKNLSALKVPPSTEHGHCRDVYCLGLLIEKFAEQIRFSTHLPTEKLQEVITDMTRPDFENRPTVQEIIAMSLFQSPYISIVNFLQSVTLKSKSEKLHFFKTLIDDLNKHHIFAEVVGRRLAPLILTPIVLAEPCAITHVVTPLLTPARDNKSEGVLPDAVFATYVIPKVVELFKMRILHVRLALIDNFSRYVHLFEKTVLTDIVLPELLHGLGDSNNQLVQASLHALADSVCVVGGDLIVGGGRQKLFSLGIPKFDGRPLNEKQSLAYEAKVPQRKRPKPKGKDVKTKEPPLPATLLELAMQRPRKKETKKPLVSEKVAMAKQKQFASSLSANVVSSLTNGTSSQKPEAGTPSIKTQNAFKSEVHEVKAIKPVFKQRQQKKTPVLRQEVETWASSDDQKSDQEAWPSFDDDEEPLPEVESDQKQVSSIQKPATRSNSLSDKSPEKRKPGRLKLGKTQPRESPPARNGASPKHGALGSEFEIVVKSPPAPVVQAAEPDFFADMAPALDQANVVMEANHVVVQNGVDLGLDAVDVRSVDSGQGSTISAAFNVVDDSNAVGWDNDAVSWE